MSFDPLTSIFTRNRNPLGRKPMDETLPDGRSVDEAVQQTGISDRMKKVSDDLLAARQAQPIESPSPDVDASSPTMRAMETGDAPSGLSAHLSSMSDAMLQQPIGRGQTRTLMLPHKSSPNTVPEMIPWDKDDLLPNETPEAAVRRVNFKATSQPDDGPRREVGRTGRMSAEELEAEPTGPKAVMPVSAVTKTPLHNDGYGAGYTRSAVDPGYVPPTSQTMNGAQRETGADASTISPNERWQAMTDAEREQTPAPQGNNITMDSPVDRVGGGRAPSATVPTVQGSGQPQTADEHMKHINTLLDKLDQLEAHPATDHDGRLRSSLLTALDLGLKGFATGGLAGAAGAALFGGAMGAVVPATNERLKQRAEILKTQGDLERAMKIEHSRATIAKIYADADKARADASGGGDAKQRKAVLDELKRRMGITNGFNPTADPKQAELAAQSGINFAPRSGGKFNPQRVKVLHNTTGNDRLVYLDYQDGQIVPRYLDVEGDAPPTLSERDRRQLDLQLARENLDRSKAGLPPMQFSDTDAPAPAAPAPAPAAAPLVLAPERPGRLSKLNPAPSQPVAAPAPQTAPAGRLSTLQPVPGGKPEPVVRPAYGGRHYGGGFRRGGGGYRASGGGNDIGQSIANNRMLDVTPQFEQMKKKGDLDGARGILNEVLTNPNTRDMYEGGVDERGFPWMRRKAQAAPVQTSPQQGVPQQSGGGQYTGMKFKLSDIKKMSAESGMSSVKLHRHIIAEGGQWIN